MAPMAVPSEVPLGVPMSTHEYDLTDADSLNKKGFYSIGANPPPAWSQRESLPFEIFFKWRYKINVSHSTRLENVVIVSSRYRCWPGPQSPAPGGHPAGRPHRAQRRPRGPDLLPLPAPREDQHQVGPQLPGLGPLLLYVCICSVSITSSQNTVERKMPGILTADCFRKMINNRRLATVSDLNR